MTEKPYKPGDGAAAFLRHVQQWPKDKPERVTLREKLEKVRDEHHEESDEGTPEMWCAKCGAFELPCDSRRLAEVALVLMHGELCGCVAEAERILGEGR